MELKLSNNSWENLHLIGLCSALLLCNLNEKCSKSRDLGPAKKVKIIPKPLSIEELGFNYKIPIGSTIYLDKKDELLYGIGEYLRKE